MAFAAERDGAARERSITEAPFCKSLKVNHIFSLIINVIIGLSFHLILCGGTSGCKVLEHFSTDVLGNIILEIGERVFSIFSKIIVGSNWNGTLLNQLCFLKLGKGLLQMEIIRVLVVQNKSEISELVMGDEEFRSIYRMISL
mgnify:CR=1 FL=1